MDEQELKKHQNETLAEVCECMSKVCDDLIKDSKSKEQKKELAKRKRSFEGLGKTFLSLSGKR